MNTPLMLVLVVVAGVMAWKPKPLMDVTQHLPEVVREIVEDPDPPADRVPSPPPPIVKPKVHEPKIRQSKEEPARRQSRAKSTARKPDKPTCWAIWKPLGCPHEPHPLLRTTDRP